jgi:exodeoxyribonuclease VII large subunit
VSRLETSPEEPVPVRVVAQKIGMWISRLGEVWVEGQIAQLSRRPGVPTQFLVLRDPDANISLNVTCSRVALGEDIREGSRVVMRARPDFYIERGTLSLRATEIRLVGLGELLAALERLKRVLAAEGLFAADKKRGLPFLPACIGLITGRASAAERDVVENVRRRLPAARFRIENVAVQGPLAVTEIITALSALDADPGVEVIVIARGGGSVEDLLPFSNEALVRAVSTCLTPVVSAVGHETDVPLLDLVADLAASTPTDAAKRIVPDLRVEVAELDELRARMRQHIRRQVAGEVTLIATVPRRLHNLVHARLDRAASDVADIRDRSRRRTTSLVAAGSAELDQLRARVRALSPQATLDRGYAVVTRMVDHVVVRDPDEARGELLVRVARGQFTAAATSASPTATGPAAKTGTTRTRKVAT